MESINFRLLDYTKYLLWGMVFTINIAAIFPSLISISSIFPLFYPDS